jgi:hypothetical protein
MELVQSLTIDQPLTMSNTVFGDGFNRLKIYHPNNNLQVGDSIVISNAIGTNNIPSTIINSTFTIESKLDNDTYEVKLPLYTPNTLTNNITNGGNVVVISYNIKFRLLFDRPYTIGNILGFRNVNKPSSITIYDNIITNNTIYEYDIPNPNINNSINLSGDNYILMTSQIFKDEAISSGNMESGIFAKILLAGDPGTVMYNQYIQLADTFKTQISSLSDFEVAFYDPLGNFFNFNNMEHSYTLEIHEDISQMV